MNKEFQIVLEEIESLISSNTSEKLTLICQILKEKIYHYDWVGFYILKDGQLILGPYSGKPTEHTQIAIGKGVCGQVAKKKETIVVQDVSQIDNYISCSIDVQSEIVVPILKNDKFIAEIDIDSHSPAPFTKQDVIFLEKICGLVTELF